MIANLVTQVETARANTNRAALAELFPALQYGRSVNLGSTRMHYIDAGQGDPILCVHGNPTWSFYWRAIINELSSTHRVIAVDHIGCGLSDKPQKYNYCLRQHIENLVQLIEYLNLTNITLVVHDWGGPIGVGAALKAPKRFRRLVLTNTACFPPPFIPWRILACRIPVLGTVLIRWANVFARAAVTMATTQKGGLSDKARRGLLAPYNNWQNRIGVDRFVFDIPVARKNETRQLLQKIESGLKTLSDKPCLMIWGMRDWCFRSECLRQLQSHFPQAQTIELAEAGHYVMEDAPREVVAALAKFVAVFPSSSAMAKP